MSLQQGGGAGTWQRRGGNHPNAFKFIASFFLFQALKGAVHLFGLLRFFLKIK